MELAKHAVENKVKTFVYTSAADGFPVVPARYLSTKREAEEGIGRMFELRGIFLRPGERGCTEDTVDANGGRIHV